MPVAPVRLYRNAYSGLSRHVWWLSFVIFINRCGTMVIPFLTLYLLDRGFTLSQSGFVMASFGIGSILGAYLGGRLTDRFGHFHIQVFSLLVNGLFFIILGRMVSFWQITGCIFIMSSLGEAFRPANSAAIAVYSSDQNRTRSYALNRLAVNLGWGIGPAVGGILSSRSYSLLFWVDGLTCILASLLLYFIFSPTASNFQKKKEVQPALKENSAYRDGIFLRGMFYIFLVGVCFFQMSSVLPAYFRTELLLNQKTTGFLLAMNGLVIAVFEMVLVYSLEGRRNPTIYMILGSFVIGIAFMELNTSKVFVTAVICMLLLTLGEMLLFPFMNNFWVKRSRESNRGQYAALYSMSFSAAIVVAPTYATQFVSHFGYTTLWVVNFFVCSFAAAGFLLLKKRMSLHE